MLERRREEGGCCCTHLEDGGVERHVFCHGLVILRLRELQQRPPTCFFSLGALMTLFKTVLTPSVSLQNLMFAVTEAAVMLIVMVVIVVVRGTVLVTFGVGLVNRR